MQPKELSARPRTLRLARYHEIVVELDDAGVERVLSDEIGRYVALPGYAVRRDLAGVGKLGAPGLGYSVPILRKELDRHFGFTRTRASALIGTGALARAFLASEAVGRNYLKVVGVFAEPGERPGVQVGGFVSQDLSELGSTMFRRKFPVGVIACRWELAQESADELVGIGVMDILNLSSLLVVAKGGARIENASFLNGIKGLALQRTLEATPA